jgi:hypothetical protein
MGRMVGRSWSMMIVLFLMGVCLLGCTPAVKTEFLAAPTPSIRALSAKPTPVATSTTLEPTPTLDLSAFAFPIVIDPSRRYLFYLHGKIVEDQGLPAIDPNYGEYEYGAILEKLHKSGFVVVSEVRSKDADVNDYANRVVMQIRALLKAGVPAGNITVVGASKGAGIVILISHSMANPAINYVLLAICAPDTVKEEIDAQVTLSGNVLSIYDSVDPFAGSCQDLFIYSEGKGLSSHAEIVLHVGTGHGVLYKPLAEWIDPAIQWAEQVR